MLNASHEGVDLQRPVRVAPGAVRWTSQTVGVVAVAGDVAIICASAWIAYLIRFRELDMPANYIYPVALAAILSANVFRWRRLYDLETYDRRARHLLNLVAAQLLVALVLVGIGFGLKTSADFSRLWLGTWMLVSSFGVSAWFYARSLVVRSAQARGLLHDRLL
ncbi:MAG: hypothetical protein GC201_07355, partial [Alphaproteobacteria bacterium]|nr:hypothetical protein [Alphaproteobacteria bacterium]